MKSPYETSCQLEREITEIRSALGDDGRRTHKEIFDLATKASQWREWKQKYLDLRNAHIAEGQDPAGTIWEHADKIQQELKASKAEVENLRAIGEIAREQQETIKKLVAEIGTVRLELVAAQESESVWKTEADKADQRRLEAEAEVERLNDAMNKIHSLASIKANKCLGCAACEEEAHRVLNPTE
jgi:uncharacterized protein YPO0396